MNLKRTSVPAQPVDPYIEIQRVGRIKHTVTLFDPNSTGFEFGWSIASCTVFGRESAERFGERELHRYLRERGYRLEPIIRITTERTAS